MERVGMEWVGWRGCGMERVWDGEGGDVSGDGRVGMERVVGWRGCGMERVCNGEGVDGGVGMERVRDGEGVGWSGCGWRCGMERVGDGEGVG